MYNQGLKFKELIVLSLRSFRTKPQRAFLTIMGMAIGISAVLLLVSLGYGLQYILIGKLITTEDSLITMEISYPTESNILIKKSVIDDIRTYEDVAEVSPVAEFPGEISTANTPGLLIDTDIVDPAYFRLAGLSPNVGKPLGKDQGVVVSSQTMIALGLKADDSSLNKMFNIKASYPSDENSSNEITVLSTPIPLQGIIVDDSMPPTAIAYTSSFPTEPQFYRRALVKAKNVDVLERLRDKLINEGFLVSARIDLVTQAKKITNVITIILGIFGITALIVSAIGMFNTMLVGFLERIYEVGVLKSLGATDYDVRNLFLVEASFMGFLGGTGGIIIGIGGGKIFNILLSVLSTKFGGDAIQLFLTPWWFVILILAVSVVIGFISGWWPAHKAAGLSPKEAFVRK
jgi:putative ABC transport system permease protein